MYLLYLGFVCVTIVNLSEETERCFQQIKMGCCPQSKFVYDAQTVRDLFPVINSEATLRKYLEYVRNNNHYDLIKNTFLKEGLLDENDMLTTTGSNVFANYASGAWKNPVNQNTLGGYKEKFMVCHNLPINDEKWNDPTFDKASMAGPDENGPGHVFITTKSLHFDTFNILPILLKRDMNFLSELMAAAITYSKSRNWANTGFYFHCYPHNSVQSFHLHVVNLDRVGPTWYKQKNKNLDITHAIYVC